MQRRHSERQDEWKIKKKYVEIRTMKYWKDIHYNSGFQWAGVWTSAKEDSQSMGEIGLKIPCKRFRVESEKSPGYRHRGQ